jgi:soluble P-type ATPase
MAKSGIRIDIPGYANLHIQAMCSDYTGTLSCGGKLIDGVRERLCRLSQKLVDEDGHYCFAVAL